MQSQGDQPKNSWERAFQIFASKEFLYGLYAGIGTASFHQWLYGSCRIGIYAYLLEQAQNHNLGAGIGKSVVPMGTKLSRGCTLGGIGSCVRAPAELALVRMWGDSKLPIKE